MFKRFVILVILGLALTTLAISSFAQGNPDKAKDQKATCGQCCCCKCTR